MGSHVDDERDRDALGCVLDRRHELGAPIPDKAAQGAGDGLVDAQGEAHRAPLGERRSWQRIPVAQQACRQHRREDVVVGMLDQRQRRRKLISLQRGRQPLAFALAETDMNVK